MIARLQVCIDGEWGTLNTRTCSNSESEIEKALVELGRLQSGWSSSYERFSGAPFRIEREKGR
jgi:hypothetical protein